MCGGDRGVPTGDRPADRRRSPAHLHAGAGRRRFGARGWERRRTGAGADGSGRVRYLRHHGDLDGAGRMVDRSRRGRQGGHRRAGVGSPGGDPATWPVGGGPVQLANDRRVRPGGRRGLPVVLLQRRRATVGRRRADARVSRHRAGRRVAVAAARPAPASAHRAGHPGGGRRPRPGAEPAGWHPSRPGRRPVGPGRRGRARHVLRDGLPGHGRPAAVGDVLWRPPGGRRRPWPCWERSVWCR